MLRLVSKQAPQPNRPSYQTARELENARLGEEMMQPNLPHWDPALRDAGIKVSADEMLKAGKAIDAAASEWTPCRSDADKRIEYAEEEAVNNMFRDYEAEVREIAQGRPAEVELAS